MDVTTAATTATASLASLAVQAPAGGADFAALGAALWESFGRLHPLVLHFPLGLVLAAALVEAWRAAQRQASVSAFTPVALWIAAATAWVAAGTGWVFAEGQSATDDLFWHRWLGIAVAVLLVPLAWKATRANRAGDPHARQLVGLVRGGTIALGLVTAWVGHLGGGMTWGDNFALRPLIEWQRGDVSGSTNGSTNGSTGAGVGANSAPSATGATGATSATSATNPGEPIVAVPALDPSHASAAIFAAEVFPVLQMHCFECHGNGKRKGRLAMDEPALLIAQNDDGNWIVKVGEPASSLLLARVLLPADHDDAMPPEGDRLTEAQSDAIRRWIESGASVSSGTPSSPGTPGTPGTPASPAAPGTPAAPVSPAAPGASAAPPPQASPAAPPAPPIAFPTHAAPALGAAAQTAIAQLRAFGVSAQPISQRDGWLAVNASARGKAFTDADLAHIAHLAPAIVDLNLARTGITDTGLQALPALPELVAVRLDSTAATDAGVKAMLGRAGKLQVVNLVGTRVSDATAAQLAGLPALTRVYLWQTAVTPDAVKDLRAAHPKALVDTGGDS